MAELKGIAYLKHKLNIKRDRGLLRYRYYDQKNSKMNIAGVVPVQLQQAYRSTLGWCSTAVDALSNRLVFSGFENDVFNMWDIFERNNADILFESAIKGALINSCDFVYISAGEDGDPRLQVIDGTNATGVINPITNLLEEGYAVLQRDENGEPISEAYFTKEYTEFIRKENRAVIDEKIENPTGLVLLVPVIYKPDSNRPFGHSRISRACMDIVDKARNTVTRGEVSAEFYSFPQKYVTGLSPDAEPLDKWRATISSLLQFDKDEDGDHPVLGQFQQQSMSPFTEQFRMYAAAFSGETGLTLEDLGFASGNPQSSEAIKAAHENLRLTAKSAQRSLGVGFKNVGYVAAALRDSFPYKREEIRTVKPLWEPLFEADSASLSGVGDAFIKLNQAFPDYVTEEKLKQMTGL